VLPEPFARIDLVLIMMVALIMNFGFAQAALAAVSVGIVYDTLSVTAFGLHLSVYMITCWVLVSMFRRVFTHISLPAFLAMNTSAFLILMTLRSAALFVSHELGGPGTAVAGSALLSLPASLGLQLAVSLALMLSVRRVRLKLLDTFILR